MVQLPKNTFCEFKMLVSVHGTVPNLMSRRVDILQRRPFKKRRLNHRMDGLSDENEDHLSPDILHIQSDSEEANEPNPFHFSMNSNSHHHSYSNDSIRDGDSNPSRWSIQHHLDRNEEDTTWNASNPSNQSNPFNSSQRRRGFSDHDPTDIRITISNIASSNIEHHHNDHSNSSNSNSNINRRRNGNNINNHNHNESETESDNNHNNIPPALEVSIPPSAPDIIPIDLTGDVSEDSEMENESRNRLHGQRRNRNLHHDHRDNNEDDDDIQILENMVHPDHGNHHNHNHRRDDQKEMHLDLTTIPSPIATEALYANLEINASKEGENGHYGNQRNEDDDDDDDCMISKIVKPKLSEKEKKRLERKRKLEQIDEWIQEDDGEGLSAKVRDLTLVCPICTDTMKDVTSTHCGHLFCESCLREALGRTSQCPLCQKAMSVLHTHRIYF